MWPLKPKTRSARVSFPVTLHAKYDAAQTTRENLRHWAMATARRLLEMTLRMVRRGSIIYPDKFHIYDVLMCCGYRHLRVDHGKRFSSGKVYINGLEGFWSYAKQRLAKFQASRRKGFLCT